MSETLRIVIADDEPKVCIVVQKCVHWEELNLELVGIAHDGQQLFEKIITEKPDLVITDIDMPEMNGLELIEQVRKQNIDCKFIIISGYRQFEYAHKALKNNVDDYLLKPIDEQELNESLHRLKMAVLNGRLHSEKAVETLISKNKRDKENIHRIFLNQILILGDEFELNAGQIEEEYGICLSEGIYQAAIAKLDNTEQEDLSDGLSAIQTKLITIFKRIFQADCRELFVQTEAERIFFGIYYDSEHGAGINEKFRQFYEYGKNIVELFIGFSLTVGVSKKHTTLQAFPHTFDEAKAAVCFRIVEGIDRTIFYEKLQIPELFFDHHARGAMKTRICKEFEALDTENFKHYMNSLYFIEKQHCNAVELKDISNFIIDTFFEKQKELGNEIENAEYQHQIAWQKVRNAISIKEMKQAVVSTVTALTEELKEQKRSQKRKPIREAMNYIADHYSENITLDVVAKAIHLNPVYFSNVFKKETGENFVDYIHKYRIEIAKVRLKEEDTPIVGIASELGYYDAKYFSKLFKKYVGVKPSDYRKIYG
ncbi:MAG: response regulator [Lachnospiraceae bacterium]